ncbi:hypothetical protein BSKO_08490 [Bryopsis sp. KO-2023]|nr:hypothetical protein BSKO_08490 [Bryopsis sp. KO-2023]
MSCASCSEIHTGATISPGGIPSRCSRPTSLTSRRTPSRTRTSCTRPSRGNPKGDKFTSSWNDIGKGGGRGGGADYLYELGKSDYNTNVDTGQNYHNIDSLFTGNVLGHKTDIADGSLRAFEFRTYNNIVGDYYVAPRFMDAVGMHIAKNYLMAQGSLPGLANVPLILGIWGPKGTGKSFQTELAFKKMGVLPVIMSAGELEHEWAGTPGRMIRERYRKASEMSSVRGKLTCLLINDLDAGVGRFDNTQVTVNNQIVVGTLMNICDHPDQASLGEAWRSDKKLQRVPIIVTGNDFSTVYAPLVRDGRMEKMYWSPTGDEVVDIVYQMYKDDGLQREEIATLRERFPDQPLDFFGALRASTYDNQIRNWITDDVIESDVIDEEADMSDLGRRLIKKENLPEFKPVQLTVEALIEEGDRLAQEQQNVNDFKLSKDYMKDLGQVAGGLIGFQG